MFFAELNRHVATYDPAGTDLLRRTLFVSSASAN
jgi:hypothetical protein